MTIVKVKWNQSKCPTPFACKKCLQICPQAVFRVNCVKTERFKETDPNEPNAYVIIPFYVSECVACNKCVEVCPNGALKIKIKEPVPAPGATAEA
jgi:ferredoxin